jgi:hypothetical protein
MASIITATTTSGLTQSADNSGVLQLASGTGNLVTVPAVTGTAMVSGNMPAFSVFANGGQSVSTGTFTKVQFNNKVFDTASAFDSTTNYRFTPNVAGYYQLNSVVAFQTMTGTAEAAIYKNGSVLHYGLYPNNSTGVGNFVSISALVYFNGTTDYVEIYAFQSSGISITLNSGGNAYVWFNGSMVRAA